MTWFGEPGGTPPPRIPRSTPPGALTPVCGRATARGTKTDWNEYKWQDGVNIQARLGEGRERFGKSLGTADLYPRQ